MNLEILSHQAALEYQPLDRTYPIRIFSERMGAYMNMLWMDELRKSDLWVSEPNRYYFDDVWPGILGGYGFREYPIDEDIASRIISDFAPYVDKTDTLLVHCLKGENRSPAVALALNDLFVLGNDSNQLREEFPLYRQFVYDTMMSAGKNLGLYSSESE